MCLTRLIYFSQNQIDTSRGSILQGLSSILSASNRNNRAANVTGALVFDDSWFLQALEGDRATVWGTLKRIEDDERHSDVVIVDARQVPERTFGNWWMGLATRNPQTAAAFAPHLDRHGRLQPHDMTADAILDLMVGLSRQGLSRKLAAAA